MQAVGGQPPFFFPCIPMVQLQKNAAGAVTAPAFFFEKEAMPGNIYVRQHRQHARRHVKQHAKHDARRHAKSDAVSSPCRTRLFPGLFSAFKPCFYLRCFLSCFHRKPVLGRFIKAKQPYNSQSIFIMFTKTESDVF